MMRLLLLPVSLARLVLISMLLALSQIWSNKMRSALTMLGIIIGVASVTAVVAALVGLQANVVSDFETLGTNKIYIVPNWPDEGPKRHASWWIIVFRPEEFEGLLEQCPSVKMFTRQASRDDTVSFGRKSIENVSITGIDTTWHEIEQRFLLLGRPFSLIDVTQGRPVCLVNPEARDKLGLNKDCVGQSISIDNRQFLVVGVVEPRPEMALFNAGPRTQAEVYVPFMTAYRIWHPFVLGIAASRTPQLSDEARAELGYFLRHKRHLAPGEPDTFRLEVIQQFLQQFNSIAGAITAVAAGVVGISLLVGGVGIMNIMLVSVSERTREIGLRKAVGARPSAILLQFLVEAVTICLVGGLIGLLVGEGLTRVIASIPAAKMTKAFIPVWAVLLSFGFATMVGLIFGMFPAIKAARLDPIDALRHE
jgi:putative ABC transport system permease protein